MLIDWFTVAAQAVNFFVLVWLLQKFLYGPVVRAMRERREKMQGEMEAARAEKEKAQELRQGLEDKREELDRDAASKMEQARQDAEKWRDNAIEEARKEVEKRREQWLDALEKEKASVSGTIKKRVSSEVTRLSRKVLGDLADSDFEQTVLTGFFTRVGDDARAVDCSQSNVVLKTGFEHSDGHRDFIDKRLADFFPDCSEKVVEVNPALGFGVELVAGDRKWEWNLSSYLDDIERNILGELSSSISGGN